MKKLGSSFFSAVIFYTVIPLPASLITSWERVACWASSIGLFLGLVMGSAHYLLDLVGCSSLLNGAIIATFWLGITGGLHLDGAMDTADGLAVNEPEKRLEVMKDSNTGAFGAMALVVILLLKTITISEITYDIWFNLILAASWSRWGQLLAIALYPYLRPTGKGAFHKENLGIYSDIFLSTLIVLMGSFSGLFFNIIGWVQLLSLVSCCGAIALVVGYYFYLKLGGHTGDTYGAVVEWSEVLILLFLNLYL